MKASGRDALRRLGSVHAHELGWRDMWAMVTAKGGRVYEEQVSRSADFNSWGTPVTLKAEVALVPLQGACLAHYLHVRRSLTGQGHHKQKSTLTHKCVSH